MRPIHRSAWLLALSSSVLQILIFPRPGLSFLCWVALAPLIYAILRAREVDATLLLESQSPSFLMPATVKQGFLLGWVNGIVWYMGTCYWVFHVMHLYGRLNSPISFVLLVLFSLYLGLHHGLFGAMLAWAAQARAGFSRRALVLAPFLWVSVELFRAYVVGFPWDLLGTTQVDNVPLARIASVTGVYGISFEIALVNTALAAGFLIHRSKRKPVLALAIMAAVVLQAEQLVEIEPSSTDSRATLVQQNIPILEGSWSLEYYEKTLHDLAAMSVPKQGAQAPRLIVWPESPAPFFLNDSRFVQTIGQVAQQSNTFVLAGSLGVPESKSSTPAADLIFNSAALVSPQGAITARYDKVHLVPFGEYVPFRQVLSFAKSLTEEVGNFTSGNDRTPLVLDGHKVAAFICYESIFPGEVREFAQHGAEVFVNISNDGWFGETGAPWQHLNMARMRAIENNRWVLRSTNTGVTATIDPMGRVVDQAPRNVRIALDVPYGRISETTFYTRNGDWFPILCAIISIIGLFIRVRERAEMTQPQPV